jgi:hypothetical protein
MAKEEKSQKVVESYKAVAAGLASVLAAVFTSSLGVAGTLIGTAVTAVLITLGSALFKVQLMKATNKVSGLPDTVRGRLSTQQIRIPGKPNAEPNPEPAAQPEAADSRSLGLLSRLGAMPGFLRDLPSQAFWPGCWRRRSVWPASPASSSPVAKPSPAWSGPPARTTTNPGDHRADPSSPSWVATPALGPPRPEILLKNDRPRRVATSKHPKGRTESPRNRELAAHPHNRKARPGNQTNPGRERTPRNPALDRMAAKPSPRSPLVRPPRKGEARNPDTEELQTGKKKRTGASPVLFSLVKGDGQPLRPLRSSGPYCASPFMGYVPRRWSRPCRAAPQPCPDPAACTGP